MEIRGFHPRIISNFGTKALGFFGVPKNYIPDKSHGIGQVVVDDYVLKIRVFQARWGDVVMLPVITTD